MSREELEETFLDILMPLLQEKDEEIVKMYIEICCIIAEDYCSDKTSYQ